MIECTKTEVIALQSNAQMDKKRMAFLHLVACPSDNLSPLSFFFSPRPWRARATPLVVFGFYKNICIRLIASIHFAIFKNIYCSLGQ